MYVLVMSGAAIREALTALRAAHDALAASEIETLPRAELLAVLDELETLSCQLPTQSHRLLARLQVESTPKAMGAKSWKDVLAIRWRISTGEANRRLAEASELGPRRALIGEALAPILPATAAAQAVGLINPEHVKVLRDAMTNLPGFVDTVTRDQIEVDLVRKAVGVGPKELKKAADRTLFLLDQDGPVPDDTERARKRGLHTGPQGRDGMRPVTGNLTPEAWATWEAIFAKYAAPGMCNPDDREPCISATPSQEQIENDHRSLAQRQHDALVAVGRIALMSGELGQLNGLPVSIIIRTSLQDLESRAGIGTTGGGSMMPIMDVIRLAAHANHYLAVFDKSTGSALDLFRTRRTASPGQRIMLVARDGGCTKPCCTVGAYGCQIHHAQQDWAEGGQTNVDGLALACGPDNRLVGTDGGWTTTINARGEVEWIPPAQLDTGQVRLNYFHRPEALMRSPEDDPRISESPIEADEPPSRAPDEHAGADPDSSSLGQLAGNDRARGGKGVRGP
ncbi:MAG: 13E12 repeat family protein [Mycolicibacterium sp.]|uniref:13E12 repeat family protein n=1 Tax=Mycolicibacterium sp. TaxID=2320850 RepID=UPI003D13A137